MSREILIDPVTRLEGHGRIHIFLDADGGVDRAYLQIPELRGFEKFVQGRRAEDMPQITSRICGVCPMAHHMAATKALDDLYQVDPPPALRKQPNSLPGAHLSKVVLAEFGQLLPDRFASITSDAADSSKINIGVTGITYNDQIQSVIRVTVQRKISKANALGNQAWVSISTTDLTAQNGAGKATLWTGKIALPTAREPRLYRLLIEEFENIPYIGGDALITSRRRLIYSDVMEL